jgi:hypothetical protein
MKIRAIALSRNSCRLVTLFAVAVNLKSALKQEKPRQAGALDTQRVDASYAKKGTSAAMAVRTTPVPTA